MFQVERLPDGISRFADAVSLDQFPSHRREHVIVFIDALQSLTGELSFHGECHEELLPHETQTGSLHGPLGTQKFHAYWSSLPPSPGSPTPLTQGAHRVAGFVT